MNQPVLTFWPEAVAPVSDFDVAALARLVGRRSAS